VISRATPSHGSGPSWTVTSGCARTFATQNGSSGAPPVDPTIAYTPSWWTRISGVFRTFPLFTPRFQKIAIGSPVLRRVFASRPSVAS